MKSNPDSEVHNPFNLNKMFGQYVAPRRDEADDISSSSDGDVSSDCKATAPVTGTASPHDRNPVQQSSKDGNSSSTKEFTPRSFSGTQRSSNAEELGSAPLTYLRGSSNAQVMSDDDEEDAWNGRNKSPPRDRRRWVLPSKYPQEPFRHRRSAKRIWDVKKKHRTDIEPGNWDGMGHYRTNILESLKTIDFDDEGISVAIPKVHRKDYTPERFYEEFMQGRKPVVIQGCMDNWPCYDFSEENGQKWTPEALMKRFPHQQFKCGEDDDGRRLRIKFKYFFDYMECQRDDSPIYLFQSGLAEETKACTLLRDFKVPDVMPFDFFSACGQGRRPPYRWFAIGPERSGTTVHKDPLGTSAWNAVVTGRKRWIGFHRCYS